jgi:hypothetical protein
LGNGITSFDKTDIVAVVDIESPFVGVDENGETLNVIACAGPDKIKRVITNRVTTPATIFLAFFELKSMYYLHFFAF